MFVVDEVIDIVLLFPKFCIDKLQFDRVKIFPDVTVKVPLPDTVDIEKVVFVAIVKVYPEFIERVPAPVIVVKPSVIFDATVRVYPELI